MITAEPEQFIFSYDNRQMLGYGSFGAVYKGQLNGLPVAVKKLKTNIPDHDVLKAFNTEVGLHEQLIHDNIVRLFRSCMQDNSYFLILELINGKDLYELMYTEKKKFVKFEFIMIMKDVLAGLDYLHDQGIVHRDIKIENIVLDDLNGTIRAKITDFGLAIPVKNSITSSWVATIDCMAPEIAKRAIHGPSEYQYGFATDIWAYGMVILEVLLGKPPYIGWDFSDRTARLKKVARAGHRTLPEETDSLFTKVIACCLQKNPIYRMGTKDIYRLLSLFDSEQNFIMPTVETGKFQLIHLAAKNGWQDIADGLYGKIPTSISFTDEFNSTPLSWAARNGKHSLVNFFIQKGADVNLGSQHPELSDREDCRFTPLDWAIQSGYLNTISNLKKANAVANYIPDYAMERIKGGDLNEVKTLLQISKTLINNKDAFGRTMLIIAALHDQLKITQYLLKSGADHSILTPQVDGMKYSGMTALDIVLAKGGKDALALSLLDFGAKIPRTVNKHFHVIHLAARNNRLDIVRKLVENEQDLVNQEDNNGRNAASWAAERGHNEILAYLNSKGVNVDLPAQSDDGGNISTSLAATNRNSLFYSASGSTQAPQQASMAPL